MFVGPGVEVYEGMIVGENARVRRHGREPHQGEEAHQPPRRRLPTTLVRLAPPRPMSLEQALEFIAADECVEVTPGTVRLRKVDPRRRASRGRSSDAKRAKPEPVSARDAHVDVALRLQSRDAYRRITLVAAVLLAIIIVTGGAVRLTDSGPRVPVVAELRGGRLTPHSASDYNRWSSS